MLGLFQFRLLKKCLNLQKVSSLCMSQYLPINDLLYGLTSEQQQVRIFTFIFIDDNAFIFHLNKEIFLFKA